MSYEGLKSLKGKSDKDLQEELSIKFVDSSPLW